jgi:hypothetical protein
MLSLWDNSTIVTMVITLKDATTNMHFNTTDHSYDITTSI